MLTLKGLIYNICVSVDERKTIQQPLTKLCAKMKYFRVQKDLPEVQALVNLRFENYSYNFLERLQTATTVCLSQVEVVYKAIFLTFRHFSASKVCESSKCFIIRIFHNMAGIKDAVEYDTVNTLNILKSFSRTWPSKFN